MKKIWVSVLVVMISLGLVAVMGGCGGDGDKGLPKSPADYLGPNEPSVIDSTTAENYFLVPWQLATLIEEISPSAVAESTETIEGSVSGNVTYWWREEETESDTKYYWKGEEKITFDNFVDDGSAFEGVLAGEGSAYFQEKEVVTFSSEPLSLDVIAFLTYYELQHQNYSAFYFSDAGNEEERSGWMTMEFNAQNESLEEPWDRTFGADIALADYSTDSYVAALDAGASLAWDGSYTSYAGHGTVCIEGDAEFEGIEGCFDVVFDFMWNLNGEGEPVEWYPIDGTAEYSTLDASVLFSFGSSASDPTCYMLSVDEDGDGEYDWEDEICEVTNGS